MQVNFKEVLKNRVLTVYLTVGDPYVNNKIVKVLAESGVDLFEFGFPTNKPKYDGLTIRASFKRALKNGVTVEKAFSIIKDFPVKQKIIFTYFDLAKSFGLEDFIGYVLSVNVKGVLFPDLLIDYLEELGIYVKFCEKYNLEPIFFITSSFPHKLVSKLAQLNPAFIYLGLMVSTGTFLPITAGKTIRIMKNLINGIPLLVGFAISKPSQVLDYIKAGADGVVVGSSIIKLLSSKQLNMENLRRYIFSLKKALKV